MFDPHQIAAYLARLTSPAAGREVLQRYTIADLEQIAAVAGITTATAWCANPRQALIDSIVWCVISGPAGLSRRTN